jgi:hypothetical protein
MCLLYQCAILQFRGLLFYFNRLFDQLFLSTDEIGALLGPPHLPWEKSKQQMAPPTKSANRSGNPNENGVQLPPTLKD